MHFLRASAVALFGLASLAAQAWEWHSAASYRAFEKMAEVANAAAVAAEPLDDFLRDQETTLEALLASQEAWARAHIEKYPARPAALAFSADPGRSDEARRTAFLMALRVAANAKFAMYLQADPWLPPSGTPMPRSALGILTDPGVSGYRFTALKAGDMVPALCVLASATDEPDFGLDVHLWDDSPSEWGHRYGFGPLPYGDPALAQASQAPFHMGLLQEHALLSLANPLLNRTFAVLRSHQFSTLASLAFRTGHPYWGWRFAGLSLHYLQDLTQPYHVAWAPGAPALRRVAANTLAWFGAPGMKTALLARSTERHQLLEKYQGEALLRAASEHRETPVEKALRATDKDRSYPEWSDHYLQDVVSQQASQAALADAPSLAAPDRPRLDGQLADWMGNFGAHSRNAVRGILKASSPPPF